MSYEFYVSPEEYEIAKQNGISYQNVNNRIRSLGWKKQRAITEPYRETRNLKEWRKVAEQNGIGYKTFKTRILRGWSMEDAATGKLISRDEHLAKIQQERRVYQPQQIVKANENGVSYEIYTRRIRDGWTTEDAMNTKPLTVYEASMRGKAKSAWTLGPSLFIKKEARV